jgi:hypothetical protein
MKKYKEPSASSGKGILKKEKFPEKEVKGGNEEGCRCKEVAKKTPSEMLRFMMDDLAFWKKGKGHK